MKKYEITFDEINKMCWFYRSDTSGKYVCCKTENTSKGRKCNSTNCPIIKQLKEVKND